MGLLVDDLLLLARLDQGRPLEREPVDLSARRARRGRRRAGCCTRRGRSSCTASGAAVVAGDELRLRQASATCWRTPARTRPQGTPVARDA